MARKEIIIDEKRNLKGIWIPLGLYQTGKLTPNDKFLLVEIYNLTKKGTRECFASNEHFSDFIGLKENTIQKMLLKLEREGYLIREYEYRRNTKEIERRIISLTDKFYDDFIAEDDVKDFSFAHETDNNPEGDGLKVGDKYNNTKNIDNIYSTTNNTNISNNISIPFYNINDIYDTEKYTVSPFNIQNSVSDNISESISQSPFNANSVDYIYTGKEESQKPNDRIMAKDSARIRESRSNRHAINSAESKRPYLPYDYTESQIREFLHWKIPELTEKFFPDAPVSMGSFAAEVITDFYQKYMQSRRKRHPVLSDRTYLKVIEKILDVKNNIKLDDGNNYPDTLSEMMDLFFRTDYGEISGNRTDYHLPYFFQPTVQYKLNNRILYPENPSSSSWRNRDDFIRQKRQEYARRRKFVYQPA